MFRENEGYQQMPVFSRAGSASADPQPPLEDSWPALHFRRRAKAIDPETVRMITRHPWLVVGICALALIGAGSLTSSITPTYEATAVLSVPPANSAMSAAPLVKSTEIEAQVVNVLRASLSPEERIPQRIRDQVDIDREQNIVRITAHSDTGRKAAITANAWADVVSSDVADALRMEQQAVEVAAQDLEAANEALRAFEEEHGYGVFGFGAAEDELQTDRERLESYKSQKDNIKQLITQASTLGASTIPGGASSSTRTFYLVLNDLLQEAAAGTENDAFHVQILRKERRADEGLLQTYETAMQHIEEALARAKSLRETIQQGGSIGSPQLVASLTVDLLRSGSLSYGTDAGYEVASLPGQELSSAQQIELLDTTIAILESRRKLVSTSMNQLSVKALDALYTMISVLERRDATLMTAIEELSADISQREEQMVQGKPELEVLVDARDRAQEAYGSLLSKIEEAGDSREAKVITSAEEPSEPVRPSWVDWAQNLTMGGVLGLVIGGIAALAVERSGLTLGGADELAEVRRQGGWEGF
jgi:uncharacterized protein involved in exopolysaccharide biosynthesis